MSTSRNTWPAPAMLSWSTNMAGTVVANGATIVASGQLSPNQIFAQNARNAPIATRVPNRNAQVLALDLC